MIYFSKKELLKDKLFLITLMVSGLPTSVMIIITPSNKDLRLFPLQELGYILVYYPYIILFFYFISQIIFRGMKLKKNNFKGQERILNKLKSNKNFSLIYDSKYLKDYDGREVFLYSISSLLTAGAYIVLIVNIFSLFITNNVKLSILTILIFFLFFYGAFFNYHKLNIQYILWTSGIFYKNSKTGVMKRFGEDIFYDKNHEFLGTYKLIQYISYISFLPNLLVIINNINL